jgi:hypothetical protein
MYFADEHISILRRETIFTLQIDGRANRTSLHQDLRRLHKNLSAPRSLISGCTLHKDWEDGKKTRLRRRGALHPKSWMLMRGTLKKLGRKRRRLGEHSSGSKSQEQKSSLELGQDRGSGSLRQLGDLFTLNCSTSESATGSVFGKSRWREREQGTHLGDAWGTARDSLRNGLPPAAACEDDGREPSSPLLLGPGPV